MLTIQLIRKNLEIFFVYLGFSVIHVDLPNNHKKVNPSSFDMLNAGFSFIRFRSVDIAENVLYHFGENSERFVFKGRRLKIGRPNKSRQQTKATVVDQSLMSN